MQRESEVILALFSVIFNDCLCLEGPAHALDSQEILQIIVYNAFHEIK